VRPAILAVALLVAIGRPRTPLAQEAPPIPSSDSAAILHAAWRAATASYGAHRPLWFWAPSTSDTGDVLLLSPVVRTALVQRQVPAFARHPAGDDTVVLRLTQWRPDSAGVLLQFRSAWTTVLGSGERRCRTRSGNVEHFRVWWNNGQWKAELFGPVLHGDSMCRPISAAGATRPAAFGSRRRTRPWRAMSRHIARDSLNRPFAPGVTYSSAGAPGSRTRVSTPPMNAKPVSRTTGAFGSPDAGCLS